jgi:hypothetical protein
MLRSSHLSGVQETFAGVACLHGTVVVFFLLGTRVNRTCARGGCYIFAEIKLGKPGVCARPEEWKSVRWWRRCHESPCTEWSRREEKSEEAGVVMPRIVRSEVQYMGCRRACVWGKASDVDAQQSR